MPPKKMLLYRFNAVRGTIIATSRFSKGTEEAAFAHGAAPITLIDGDKLIDLLIEHNIGVRKRTIEVLAVDPTHSAIWKATRGKAAVHTCDAIAQRIHHGVQVTLRSRAALCPSTHVE